MASFIEELKDEQVEMDLTPMIDVTFLLLVFFMLAAKFKTQEGQIQTYLPKDRGMAAASHKEVSETRIFIAWCEPGSYQYSKDPKRGRPVLWVIDPVAGRRSFERGGMPDYDSLMSFLLQQKEAQRGKNDGEGLKVVIDAQPAVPWKHVVETLDAVVSVGIKEVTFAAREEPY